MLPIVWVVALAAPATDARAPEWPAKAALQASSTQILWDEPARTEGELSRRTGLYRVHLAWPAATDDVGVTAYRVRRGGQVMAVLPGDARTYEAETKGAPAYAVEAGDAAGHWSAALRAEVSDPASDPSGEPVNAIGGLIGTETVADFGGLGGTGESLGLGSIGRGAHGPPQVHGGLRPDQVAPVIQAQHDALAKCGRGAGQLRLVVRPDGHVSSSVADRAAPARRPCFEAVGRAIVFPTASGPTTVLVALE